MDLGVKRVVPVARRRAETGLTLIEALVASAILLIVSLGVLPLFVRSIADNAVGRESTELTNYARSQIERYSEFDFYSPELTVTDGSSLVVEEYFSPESHTWVAGAAPANTAVQFTRTTTVRQFSASALEDGVLAEDEALDAATSVEFVHMKEVVVVVQATRELETLGPTSRITLRVVRSV